MESEIDEEQQISVSLGTSKAHMYEQDTDFGDQNCGEPLLAQRLLIDFTPNGDLDLDSEYNQKKCRSFWNFIKSKPELQHLMVIPEPVDHGESFTLSDYTQSESWSQATEPMERTAVSTLELFQKEGQMEPAFLGMVPQSHCSLGSREYPEPVITKNTKKAKKKTHVCACTGSCDSCRRNGESSRPRALSNAVESCRRNGESSRPRALSNAVESCRRNGESSQPRAPSNAVAVDLCQKIKKWDAAHPKSMEPPGHPSNLCTARRKL